MAQSRRNSRASRCGGTRRAAKSLGRRVLWVFWGAHLAFALVSAPAPAQVTKEYQLKAVFLWRLAQFTEWPRDAFESSESPIVICVFGDNPFDGALTAAVAGETAHGRKFSVQQIKIIDQARACHILYMLGIGSRQAKELSTALAGRNVLTVRDGDKLANPFESVIGFVTEKNRLRLQVNLKAAQAAGLVLDPRLLRAAEVIDG